MSKEIKKEPKIRHQMEILEVLDGGQVRIPERSRLYHLPPVGVGTRYIECLTSYIARLADMHNVAVSRLVNIEILPLLGRKYIPDKFTWGIATPNINGTGILSKLWVDILQYLTARTDLLYLTFLSYTTILPASGLLRRNKVWCPLCFEEWKQQNTPVYEPLLWHVPEIMMCIRHQIRLVSTCPFEDCSKTSTILSPQSRPGYCSHCNRWLGQNALNSVIEPASSSEVYWQTWITENLGDLLAFAPHYHTILSPLALPQVLSNYIDHFFDGNTMGLVRQLRSTISQVYNWKRGDCQPRII